MVKHLQPLVMAALWNRAGHYIFAPVVSFFLLSFFFSSPNLSGRRSDVYHTSTHGVALVHTNTSSTCPHNMVNFGLLTAEICWRVWGTPANFNDFRVLAALLHSTLVVGVEQRAPPIFDRVAMALGIGPHF